MLVVHGCHHGPWHGIRLEELRIFIALSPTRGIDLVVEEGVFDVDLTRVDTNNRSYHLQISNNIGAVSRSMYCTVSFVHLFDLEKKLSAFDDIIIKLVEAGYGSELGARNLAERMKIKAIDPLNDEINDYPAHGEW